MNKVLRTIKNNLPVIKKVLYIILGFIALYYLILLITPKPQISVDFQNRLDSLSKVTDSLEKQIVKHDIEIQHQVNLIDVLDRQIESVKESKTIIKEYYHEQSKAADRYTPTQLDSFFAKRYGY